MTTFEGFSDDHIEKTTSCLEKLRKKRLKLKDCFKANGGLLHACLNNLMIRKRQALQDVKHCENIQPYPFMNGFSDDDTRYTTHKILKLNDELQHLRKWVKENTEGMFICKKCDRPFETSDALNVHQVVHQTQLQAKAKPYTCPLCLYACERRFDLEKHLQMHVDTNPFKCSLCGTSFNDKVDIQSHLWTHLTACPVCDKKFDEMSNRNVHLAMHLL